MAGTITKLEIQKRAKERVNVFLDEKFAFGVTLNVALELKKGQFLSDAEIRQLTEQDERHQAYARALYYLGFRARSRGEVERYLREKEFSPEAVTWAVQRLVAEKYLDDEAFAQTWTDNRQTHKPKSRRALNQELRQKGVDGQTIETILSEVDEDEAARQALAGKLRQWQNLDEETFRKKAMGFLGRRGFGFAICRAAVDEAWQSLIEGG
jgi:regulatory protein